MKVVIAIDSLKGSLTSLEAGEAIKKGIHLVRPDADVRVRPLADGGEGTVEALYFDNEGYMELWSGTPGDESATLDNWQNGNWTKILLYSGSYRTEGTTLYLDIDGRAETITYSVNMVGLFDMEMSYAEGEVIHFEQVSW